jgi:hypothetical protein
MKYQCETCKKTFIHPAKVTENTYSQPQKIVDNTTAGTINLTEFTSLVLKAVETPTCPHCKSKEYVEFVEPIVTEEIANVYIYDLTNGPQTDLDGLLAQGYRIVNRYSKQYHLEKPKEAKP